MSQQWTTSVSLNFLQRKFTVTQCSLLLHFKDIKIASVFFSNDLGISWRKGCIIEQCTNYLLHFLFFSEQNIHLLTKKLSKICRTYLQLFIKKLVNQSLVVIYMVLSQTQITSLWYKGGFRRLIQFNPVVPFCVT